MRRAPTSTEEFERRPKTARKSEIDTKTKLLNAAERLFSDKGIEAVSHGDIALAAAVNLAALNYHFGSRQAFIQALIKRRVEPINAHRLAALARAERQMGGAPVPTDKILEAFFGPAVEDPEPPEGRLQCRNRPWRSCGGRTHTESRRGQDLVYGLSWSWPVDHA